jgi:hypothetical protein
VQTDFHFFILAETVALPVFVLQRQWQTMHLVAEVHSDGFQISLHKYRYFDRC